MGLFGGRDDEEPDSEGPTFDDLWEVQPDTDRGWEYRVVHARAVTDAVGGDFDDPDDVLNALGKEGWELVGTVEGRSLRGASGADDGTTAELLFKRPATYRRRGEDPDADSPEV